MNLQNIAYSLPGILIGLTVHEFCHAWAAYKLGDTTAKDEGRLTFNPLKHIDIIGFLFIIVAGFGWAKPVRFSPENLKNLRRDKAIIAAAGPASNFVLALIFVAIVKIYLSMIRSAYETGNDSMISSLTLPFVSAIFTGILQAAAINFGLFIFNLLPLPPLDGSHIFFSGLNLPPGLEYKIMKIGAPLLFIVIIIQNRTSLNILPIGKFIQFMLGVFLPELK